MSTREVPRQIALPCEGCGTDVVVIVTDQTGTAMEWAEESLLAWCPACWAERP